MAYKVRRSSHGGDRSRGRSLTELLNAGNDRYGDEGWTGPTPGHVSSGEIYDEASGPRDMTRRPPHNEWESRDILDVANNRRGHD